MHQPEKSPAANPGTQEFLRGYACTEKLQWALLALLAREPVVSNLPIKRLKRTTWIRVEPARR